MKESTAYLMTNVLEYAAHHGFSGGTSGYGGTKAVKTGTSNFSSEELARYGLPSSAVKDLWSVAYTSELSISLWYGYEKTSSDYYLGGASAPKDNLMYAVMKTIPVTTKPFNIPSSVKQITVENLTYPPQLPSDNTPGELRVTEWFAEGSEPNEVSTRFSSKLSDVKNLKASPSISGTKITWESGGSDPNSDEVLNKYFAQDAFGNSGNAMTERIKGILGAYGYGIYVDGKSVGFTKDKSYTYKPTKSGNVTITVKTEYQNFKGTASNGVSVKTNVLAPEEESDKLVIKAASTGTGTIGHYNDGELTVEFEGEDVTEECTINYSIKIGNKTISKTTKEALEKEINKITEPGKYTINYSATYKIINKARHTKTIELTE
ncbi:MAG: hypothetical protein IJI98_10355, partial [Methanosphaera sp.]|nr:hypothetical protein [Methanosphaera sp.]